MGELSRGERLQVMLTAEELAALDDFRFKRRMPSRASAVRELLKRGLIFLLGAFLEPGRLGFLLGLRNRSRSQPGESA